MKIKFTQLVLLVSIFFSSNFNAQVLPTCPDTAIYMLASGMIHKFYPSLPISATNPSTYIPASGITGISLNNNLNGTGPSPTFYGTLVSGNYSYWNGFTWIPTGFNSGSANAVNPGGGGCYIYNLVGATGQVYRYDGSGNGTLLMTMPAFAGGGPYDLASDVDGNFYALKTSTPQSLDMFDFTGAPLISYNMTGMPPSNAGGGFVIDGSKVYALTFTGFYKGILSGATINFTLAAPTSSLPAAGDWANCATLNTGITAHAFNNTGPWSCANNTVALQAIGWPPSTTYNWTGPSIIGSTTSSSAVSSSNGVYTCTVTAPGNCPTVLTTVVTATAGTMVISATPTNTTICSGGNVSLSASGGINYTWTPSASLSSPNGTIVSANPTSTTIYTLSATAGTCTGAPKTITVNVNICTDVNELENAMLGLNIYPNPNSGEFAIKSNVDLKLNLINELGQVVKILELNSETNHQFTITDISNGIYFLRDENSGKAMRNKIVVIRN